MYVEGVFIKTLNYRVSLGEFHVGEFLPLLDAFALRV